jgi:hypothetical protein
MREPHGGEFDEAEGEQVGETDGDGEFELRTGGLQTHFYDLFFGASHAVLQSFEAFTDAEWAGVGHVVTSSFEFLVLSFKLRIS